MSKYNSTTIPDAAWKLKDVLIVAFSVILITLLFYLSTLALFGDRKWNFTLSRYIASILTIFFPIIWIKRKYGLSKKALGLTSSNANVFKFALIGLAAAIVYSFIYYYVFLGLGLITPKIINNYSYLNLLLLPISISGFATIVLSPISEEIMIRGYLYGYLRTRLGAPLGIALQSLLFASLHYNIFRDSWGAVSQAFFVGLIFGILYEKSGSIYPSMISHGFINYFVIVATAFK